MDGGRQERGVAGLPAASKVVSVRALRYGRILCLCWLAGTAILGGKAGSSEAFLCTFVLEGDECMASMYS